MKCEYLPMILFDENKFFIMCTEAEFLQDPFITVTS